MFICRIYKICNTVDDKEYVGSTKQKLAQRLSEHKSRARGNKKNMDINNHMKKLGIKK